MFLFQSVDRRQTRSDCARRPMTHPRARLGGIRIFDATNPRRPRFVRYTGTAINGARALHHLNPQTQDELLTGG